MKHKSHNRGAITKTRSQLIAVWIPNEMASAIDSAVQRLDTDRSKFVREAIREHTRRKAIA